MKTVLKILGVLCLIFIVLLAGTAFLVTSPSFQKRIALSFLQDQGEEVSLNYVKLGLSGGQIEGLAFRQPNLKVELREAEVRYSWRDALFRKIVQIETLRVEGLVVDLRLDPVSVVEQPHVPGTGGTPRPAASTPTKPPAERPSERITKDRDWDFSGIFPNEGLPIPLYLKQGDIELTLLLPEERRAELTVALRDLAPGSEGTLSYTAGLTVPQPDAAPVKLQSEGTLSVRQDDRGLLQELAFAMETAAEGGPLAERTVLNADALAKRQPEGGELYRLSLRDATGTDLVKLDAVFPDPETGLQGNLELAVRDAQIKPFLVGLGLPVFSVEGTSTFTVIPAREAVSLKSTFHGKVSELQRMQGDLTALGALDFSLKLEADLKEEQLRLDAIGADIKQASGEPVLFLHALQAFSLDLSDPVAGLNDLSGELVRLELAGLPVSWASPFFPEGLDLNMSPLAGTLVLSVPEVGQLRLESPQPWVFSLQSLHWKGQEQLDQLRLRVDPSVLWSQDRMHLQLRDLFIDTRNIPVLTQGSLKASRVGESTAIQLRLAGDLAQLLQQPALRPYDNVGRGVFQIQLEADLAEHIDYSARLELNQLMQRSPARTLGNLNVELKGAAKTDVSAFDMQGPVHFVGATGVSDLQLDLKLNRDDEKTKFKGDIRGQALYVDDFTGLAALFAAPPSAPPASPGVAPAPAPTAPKPSQAPAPVPGTPSAAPGPVVAETNELPIWVALEGDASLELERLQAGNNRFNSVSAALEIRDTHVSLKGFKATFLDSPIQAQGKLTFDQTNQAQRPYGLEGTFGVTDFNLGRFLTQGRPGARAPMEGVFRVNGSLGGRGPGLDTLADWAQGDFKLEGRQGRLSVLAAAGETVQTGGQLVGTALGIASLVTGNRVRELPALNQLIRVLQEIPYDELVIDARRDEDLDINLNQFLMAGPELKLTGQGQVRYVEGRALALQPLTLKTGLSAKGNTAGMLHELRLLGDKKDSQGYISGFGFTITGTPSQPDFSELRDRIISAGTAMLSQGLIGSSSPGESTTREKESPAPPPENPLRNLLERFNR